MRQLFVIASAIGLLAGCGEPPTNAEQLAQKCFEDQMGTHENCDCLAREAETWLGEELLGVFVTLNNSPADSTDEATLAARERFSDLTPEESRKVDSFQAAAVDICGLKR